MSPAPLIIAVAGIPEFHFANYEGVGQTNRVGDRRGRTTPRKIRARFQGYKHTSLNQDASNLRQVYHASIVGALQSVGRG